MNKGDLVPMDKKEQEVKKGLLDKKEKKEKGDTVEEVARRETEGSMDHLVPEEKLALQDQRGLRVRKASKVIEVCKDYLGLRVKRAHKDQTGKLERREIKEETSRE